MVCGVINKTTVLGVSMALNGHPQGSYFVHHWVSGIPIIRVLLTCQVQVLILHKHAMAIHSLLCIAQLCMKAY